MLLGTSHAALQYVAIFYKTNFNICRTLRMACIPSKLYVSSLKCLPVGRKIKMWSVWEFTPLSTAVSTIVIKTLLLP